MSSWNTLVFSNGRSRVLDRTDKIENPRRQDGFVPAVCTSDCGEVVLGALRSRTKPLLRVPEEQVMQGRLAAVDRSQDDRPLCPSPTSREAPGSSWQRPRRT